MFLYCIFECFHEYQQYRRPNGKSQQKNFLRLCRRAKSPNFIKNLLTDPQRFGIFGGGYHHIHHFQKGSNRLQK